MLALCNGVGPFYPGKQVAATSIGAYDDNIVSRKQKFLDSDITETEYFLFIFSLVHKSVKLSVIIVHTV